MKKMLKNKTTFFVAIILICMYQPIFAQNIQTETSSKVSDVAKSSSTTMPLPINKKNLSKEEGYKAYIDPATGELTSPPKTTSSTPDNAAAACSLMVWFLYQIKYIIFS